MSEDSLHDLGISLEFVPIHEQLPHRKAIYVCAFDCVYLTQSRATACTHTHKEHLNTMLACPHCDHHVWSIDAWVKHVHHHQSELPMFLELKLQQILPTESTEILEAISVSQDVKKWMFSLTTILVGTS